MTERVIGMLAALGAILSFGSYAVPIRMESVMSADIDPVVFQTYKSFACFATSLLVLFFVPLRFTWWGVLGAALWVLTGIVAISAVRLAGIGSTQSLWSGITILVSYIWGAYIFREPIRNATYSLVALVLMSVGMTLLGMAASGNRALFHKLKKLKRRLLRFSRQKQGETFVGVDVMCTSLLPQENDGSKCSYKSDHKSKQDSKSTDQFMQGISCAVVVGILNGSSLIPLQYASKDVPALEYLLSFGVGAMAVTLLVLGTYFFILSCSGKSCPLFKFSVVAGPALATGLLWSIGNFCSIYATLFLGYSLGMPLVQCQLLVSAMWAVFYYKEVTSTTAAGVLLGASLVVVVGAGMLAEYGTYK